MCARACVYVCVCVGGGGGGCQRDEGVFEFQGSLLLSYVFKTYPSLWHKALIKCNDFLYPPLTSATGFLVGLASQMLGQTLLRKNNKKE